MPLQSAALVSALSERPVPVDCITFGEVSLSGEVRPVAHAPLRLKEATKLGFERGWVPTGVDGDAIRLERFGALGQLVDKMLGR